MKIIGVENGREYDLEEVIDANYTEQVFEDEWNDVDECVKVGKYEYPIATVLKKVDYVAFYEEYLVWLDNITTHLEAELENGNSVSIGGVELKKAE